MCEPSGDPRSRGPPKRQTIDLLADPARLPRAVSMRVPVGAVPGVLGQRDGEPHSIRCPRSADQLTAKEIVWAPPKGDGASSRRDDRDRGGARGSVVEDGDRSAARGREAWTVATGRRSRGRRRLFRAYVAVTSAYAGGESDQRAAHSEQHRGAVAASAPACASPRFLDQRLLKERPRRFLCSVAMTRRGGWRCADRHGECMTRLVLW
jgi:hypothetical protein